LRVIKLKKEGKEIRPIALYEKIIIEFPIVNIGRAKSSGVSLLT
jgi:predicted transcriptional regulator